MKMVTPKNQHGFAHIVIALIVVVLVAGAGFLVYQRTQNANDAKQANSTSDLPTATKTTTRLSVTKAVEFGTAIDSMGKIVTPLSSFAPSDGKINAVSALQNAPKGMKIEYVRYRDNKFVDNGSLTIAKDGAQYAGFNFTPKSGKKHPTGVYKVKIYANGEYQTAGNYTVK